MIKSPIPQGSSLGELFAGAGKTVIILVVLASLGLHTLNFFAWTFPEAQAIYRPLGFGLTGGAFIVYVLVFKYGAKTDLKRFVALSMIIICGLGELAAAGFGMQIEAYTNAGIQLTAKSIDLMIWAIRILGGIHAVALVLDFIGDDIGEAWKKKGVPISTGSIQRIDDTVFDRRQNQPSTFRYPYLTDKGPIISQVPHPTNEVCQECGFDVATKGHHHRCSQWHGFQTPTPKDEPTSARVPFQPE